MDEDERIDLLTQVAIWYYEEGLNQADIAQRIDKSRSMVSRLLDQAREAGLVEVRVRHPLRTDGELEQRLCCEFNLAEARVLAEPPEDYRVLLRRLGELGARRLQESLHPGIIIGLSWGSAVHAVVTAMPTSPIPNSTIVQLIGAVGHGDPMVDGVELGRWLAQKMGASFRFLSAPLLVKDEAVAQALRSEWINQETLAMAAQAEVAVIGIGTPEPEYSSLLRAGYLSRSDLEELVEAGVVGDIVAHHFDKQGRVLDIPANRRSVSLDADSIRKIPKVIAVSGSVSKARAIAAALRGGFCNCLVTDAKAAQMVLELAASISRESRSQRRFIHGQSLSRACLAANRKVVSMFEIERVVSAQNEVGESPRWDATEQSVYWLDIWDSPAVFRFQPQTSEITRWAPGLPVTGQARREKGGFVFASRTGLYFWDERTGESQFILDPEAGNGPVRFNDGSADRMGRFWAGSTYADDQFRPEGSLYRMTPGRSVQKMAGGLACSNGLGWSPDNQTMYVTAQFAYELLAFDFDLVTGEIANRRSFAKVPEADGLPDGLTVDAEGCIWSAQWGGWRLTRYDPDGKIERVVRLPVPNPTSCVFGGPDLKDLYVTTAWLGLSDAERQATPGSGDLFVVHTDIQGLPEPKFAG